jgi:hypothetical protein
MSTPIRDPSTNAPVGELETIIPHIRAHLRDQPQKNEGRELVDVINEFGFPLYPQIMRLVTPVRFSDAHNLYEAPTNSKNM